MMKKWIALMVCVLALMVCVGAGAESRVFTDVPNKQYKVIVPDGIVLAKDIRDDGKIQLQIQDEAWENGSGTNWLDAIRHTCTSWGDVEIMWRVKVPTFTVNGQNIQPANIYIVHANPADFANEDEKLAWVNEQFSYVEAKDQTPILGIDSDFFPETFGGFCPSERTWTVASTVRTTGSSDDATEGLLVPKDQHGHMFLGWYDQNNQPLGFQKLYVEYTHTSTEAFTTAICNPIPKKFITADPNFETSEVKDGEVCYYLPNVDDQATTTIKAPDDKATHYSIRGSLKMEDQEILKLDGSLSLTQFITRKQGRDVHTSTTWISFYSSNDGHDLLGTYSFIQGYRSEENILPWIAYAGYQTIGENDLVIINGAESAGYEVTFDPSTAHLTRGYEHNGFGSEPQPIQIQLRVPKGAVSYRLVSMGGNNLMGNGTQTPAALERAFDSQYPKGPIPVTGSTVIADISDAFQKLTVKNNNNLTVYVPADMSAKVHNHAAIYAVEWYDDCGDIMDGTFYFWETLENFTVEKKDVKVMQQKDLKKMIEEPTVVLEDGAVLFAPNGKPYEDLYMRYIAYITDRDQSWSFDLNLVNKPEGAPETPAKPNTPVWIYLPYPEGHTPGQKYKINHYIDGSFEEDGLGVAEPIEVKDMLYGLAFQTDSFSPFILTAEEGSAPTPPATGDATPVAFLATLALLSAAGVLLIRRRVKAN